MCGTLPKVARHAQVLLTHGLRELEVIGVWGYIGYLSLHGKLASRQLLLRLDHAHVDILLVGSSNLLLLCLQYFDLLRDSELFHCFSIR